MAPVESKRPVSSYSIYYTELFKYYFILIILELDIFNNIQKIIFIVIFLTQIVIFLVENKNNIIALKRDRSIINITKNIFNI